MHHCSQTNQNKRCGETQQVLKCKQHRKNDLNWHLTELTDV